MNEKKQSVIIGVMLMLMVVLSFTVGYGVAYSVGIKAGNDYINEFMSDESHLVVNYNIIKPTALNFTALLIENDTR